MAAKMEALAAQQRGYLGFESARNNPGIAVSYWKDEQSIYAWKKDVEHQVAQKWVEQNGMPPIKSEFAKLNETTAWKTAQIRKAHQRASTISLRNIMMTVTISDIQQAAKGGFARVDAAGQWKTGGKGLGGRVIAWFTGMVSRGKVARENRATIDHFVRAIGSDTRYGDSFVMLATHKLRPLSTAGKPLRERVVTQVLSEIEDIRDSHDKMNLLTAERLSTTDPKAPSQRDRASIGFTSLLYRAAQQRGLPPGIKTDAAYVKKAAADIRQEIMAAGDNGKKMILDRESSIIAMKRIGKLTDELVTLDNILETSGMGEEEQHSLMQRLAGESVLSKENIFSYIHGGRTNQLAYESGELPKMLSQAAEAEGIGELVGDLTLQAGVDSGMVIRVTSRLKTEFPDAVATKAEICSRLSDEVSGYVAARKKLMDYVDTCDLAGEAHADMYKMIAQDPSIKKTAHVDTIIAVAPSYESFCQSIRVGGAEEIAAAYVRHQQSFDQAIEPLMHSGMTVDEVAPRRTQALSLWVAQQKDKGRSDPGQADDIRRDMELAYNNLTGSPGDKWVDSTVWVAEQHRRGHSEVDDIARNVQNLRHIMAEEIGGYLGIKPADVADASPTREGIAANIGGETEVPDNVYCMFRDLGVKVPLPELMGRSKAEAFNNRFSEAFLQAINGELTTTRNRQNGIDEVTYRDLGRANFFTGEPGTPETLLTSARIGEGKEAALGVFNRLFDDNHDEAGKQAMSKVTHQGIFAETDRSSMNGYGPFSQVISLAQEAGESDISYRIWQEPGGSGYRVQASLAAPVSYLVDPADGAMRLTDKATSKFAFEVTFRVSRQSINDGNPQAELVTAPTYEYRIDPAKDEDKLPAPDDT